VGDDDDGFGSGWLSRRAFETNPIGKGLFLFFQEWMMVLAWIGLAQPARISKYCDNSTST
jgi:hypothetical protein